MSEMRFLSSPLLSHGPAHAPLIASLTAETKGGEALRVRVRQNGDVWTVTFPISDGPYLLLGFHPEGAAEVTVQLVGQDGVVTWPETLSHALQDIPTCPLGNAALQDPCQQPKPHGGKFHFPHGSSPRDWKDPRSDDGHAQVVHRLGDACGDRQSRPHALDAQARQARGGH